MDVESCFLHHCVEPVVSVSGVIHGSDRSIRLHQTVLAFNVVPVSVLPLTLYVARVQIFDAVVEQIIGMGLEQKTEQRLENTDFTLSANA